MKARDIMITNVVTVGPELSVREVAEILVRRRVSALPVVDSAGNLIGIVSEGDLLRRAELDTGYRRSWWLELFNRKSDESLANEFARSHASRVKDVMAKNVITARASTSLRGIAAILERYRIKRVPIVAKGKVIGIVSRANLIQALASLRKDTEPTTATDSLIRKNVMRRFKAERWSKHAPLNVIVQDGTVKLWGVVGSEAERQAARVAAELARGVRAVENNIVVLQHGHRD